MRNRAIWLMVLFALITLLIVGCSIKIGGERPTATPTRTPLPTFTPTPATPDLSEIAPAATPIPQPAEPTLVPQPQEAAQPEQPLPTEPPAPPTTAPVAAPTPFLTITGDVINLRGGPGTSYPAVGKAQAGQTYAVTGKNEAGDWWHACCLDEQEFWIAGQFARLEGSADAVELAANIPPPLPTARPRPTTVPQPTTPPQPTAPPAPPAPTYTFSAGGVEPRPNSNRIVTVWGRVFNQNKTQAYDGYKVRVLRSGTMLAEGVTGNALLRADSGLASAFMYNAKVELLDFTDGPYTAQLLDGGGQPAGPEQPFTVSGETRTFLVTWTK